MGFVWLVFCFQMADFLINIILKRHKFSSLAVKFELLQFVSGLLALDCRKDSRSVLYVSKISPSCN